MNFAFLVHPLSEMTREIVRLFEPGRFPDLLGDDLFTYFDRIHHWAGTIEPYQPATGQVTPRVIDEIEVSHASATNACHGRLYEIPMLANEILEDPSRAVALMEQAAEDAHRWGADIIGLGSMTGIVGGRGQHLAEVCPSAITTGNSLTVYSTIQALIQVCIETDTVLEDTRVCVVGVPGSIAASVARWLRTRCRSLTLAGRRSSARTDRLVEELGATFTCNLESAVAENQIVITATSSGSCLDQQWLAPGSVVIDVAMPADVIGTSHQRDDVLILTGGLTTIREPARHESTFLRFQRGVIPSCLGETIVLSLDERRENYSIGQDLSLERIEHIGQLAEFYDLDFSQLISFGHPLDAARMTKFRKSLVGVRTRNILGRDEYGSIQPGLVSRLATSARKRFATHINPVMESLGGASLKTFVRGEDCYLWDDGDNRFLDFVAGFGSVNTGHNHPHVVRTIRQVLSEQAPGFAQAAINPLAAALAEQLIALTPAGLEMVFFTNSGTESVEAALKLARKSTGRQRFLSCRRGFHGKSLGALSVCGHREFQDPFRPLMQNCDVIDFGDEEQLQKALAGRDFAGLIVEPIQGEGGVQVPSRGFLAAAQRLCNQTGTLLVVDEIQTGMGRTGKMFACEHDGIVPDIMTLAKSLGGGLVPIGAMICRSDLWHRSYGTSNSFMLHSSTFGGGSVACAAGLATLDVIVDDGLLENATAQGDRLKLGLDEICQEFAIVKQVRGRGLMLGLEFNALDPSLAAHAREGGGWISRLMQGPELAGFVDQIPVAYVVYTMMNQFQILTQTARSNPNVLRIQPPLTIASEQVDEFLDALRISCSGFDLVQRLGKGMYSASAVGDHKSAMQ